jgi:hypothetical protein
MRHLFEARMQPISHHKLQQQQQQGLHENHGRMRHILPRNQSLRQLW